MFSRCYTIIFFIFLLVPSVKITAQTLGNYPNASVSAGQNITITPATAPTASNSVVAYTNTNFTGVLSVNPTTGVVAVTNARMAGNYLVTVKAFGAGTATKTFTLIVNNPSGSEGGFCGATDLLVGEYPSSPAIGDFNRDGKQDIAVANRFSNNVSIRLGDGAGNFGGSTNVPVGTYPISVAIGDFNGDGRQDIAAANQTGNNVSIRLGDGAGGFTGTTQVAVGVYPLKIAVGDFNTDGKQDIVTANYFDPTSSSISVRLGAEGGTNTWLGLSTDWNSPSNWSAGMVPAACANVVVNTGVSYWPIVTGINNTCFMITVGNGASVIIGPGARLDITGK